MDVTPINTLLGELTDAGRPIAPALAGLGFLVSALHFLLSQVAGSPRGKELAAGGMIASVVGLAAVFFSPQIMSTVHVAFGS